MRIAFVLVSLVLWLGGCAGPRYLVMEHAIRNDVPVMAGGSRDRVDIRANAKEGLLPFANIDIESPRSAGETLAWYRQELLAQEWTLVPPQEAELPAARGFSPVKPQDWYSPPIDGEYVARRERRLLGVTLARERLALHFRERDSRTSVWVSMQVDYFYAESALCINDRVIYPLGWLALPLLPIWLAG